MGDGFLLPTLAAVFVGGTSVFGGRGSDLGHVPRRLHDRRHQAGHRRGRPERLLPQVIYGAVILVSVSIHALLQRRFEY